MKIKQLAETLINKLDKQELAALVESWDSDNIRDLMESHLIPVDMKNNPGKYFDPDLTYQDDPDLNDETEDPYDQDDPAPM